jgi:hypothetical protein
MDLHHISDLCRATVLHRVDAQDEEFVFLNRSVEQLFMLGEVMPTDFGKPREVAGCPHSGIAPRQRMIEFLDPTLNNLLDIEVSVCEVPFGVWDDLDLPSVDISVKMRHSLSHGRVRNRRWCSKQKPAVLPA